MKNFIVYLIWMKHRQIETVLKYVLFFAALLAMFFLAGCSEKEGYAPPLGFEGAGTNYSEGHNPMFKGVDIIESSLITSGNTTTVYFNNDLAGTGTFGRIGLDQPAGAGGTYGDGMWYSYVFNHDDKLYFFYNDRQAGGGSIYLKVSDDQGNTWSKCNGGQPVVSHQAGTQFNVLYNVGVDVDDQGTWHMLIDAYTDGVTIANMNLSYMTATMTAGCMISFDGARASAQVIPNSGAPFVKFIPGKGMLAVIQVIDPSGYWILSTAILKNGSWVVDTKFKIGAPSIHVCDPSATDLPGGGSLITMSYNQNSLYGVYSKLSLSELYDQVEAEL